ncbi:MAG TPA: hypothetical protein VGR67_08290 [Candidatus Polarisedimenticolia bacterium]|nr:hypothetical protein [Candidatus Polarisedimenticolia bacterium]
MSHSGLDDPESNEPALEGKAWCLRCGDERGYVLSKIEFLGNPVRASFFCTECGARVSPDASDRSAALKMRSEGRWLRFGAVGSLLGILLLPPLFVVLALYLLWKML